MIAIYYMNKTYPTFNGGFNKLVWWYHNVSQFKRWIKQCIIIPLMYWPLSLVCCHSNGGVIGKVLLHKLDTIRCWTVLDPNKPKIGYSCAYFTKNCRHLWGYSLQHLQNKHPMSFNHLPISIWKDVWEFYWRWWTVLDPNKSKMAYYVANS